MTARFQRSLARYQAACAEQLGCGVDDFRSDALSVVARPDGSRPGDTAVITTFGTGTVISVLPPYFEFVSRLAFGKHYQAFRPQSVVVPVLDEAAGRGERPLARGASLGFLLDRLPPAPRLPDAYHLAPIDEELRARWHPGGAFPNGLGEPDESPEVHASWLYGLALLDARGEPVAIAGAYKDRGGHTEVGVDVAHACRGQRLAPAAVGLLTRQIVARGSAPTYYCAASNMRSHRTALASGFLPAVCTIRVELGR